jgi:hypothetical protein
MAVEHEDPFRISIRTADPVVQRNGIGNRARLHIPSIGVDKGISKKEVGLTDHLRGFLRAMIMNILRNGASSEILAICFCPVSKYFHHHFPFCKKGRDEDIPALKQLYSMPLQAKNLVVPSD